MLLNKGRGHVTKEIRISPGHPVNEHSLGSKLTIIFKIERLDSSTLLSFVFVFVWRWVRGTGSMRPEVAKHMRKKESPHFCSMMFS